MPRADRRKSGAQTRGYTMARLLGALAVLIISLALASGTGRRAMVAPPVSGRTSGDADSASGRRLNASAPDLAAYDRAFPGKTIPAGAWSRGIEGARALRRYAPAGGWRELGPVFAPGANLANPQTHARTAVSGRVTALAVDPRTCSGNDCGTIYVGAASGGLWKTTNAGRSWRPLTDSQIDLAIGVITLDPKNPDIVYVGTGDPDHGGGSHRGIGILRSLDAGHSWTTLGAEPFANRAISSILVDPRTAGGPDASLDATSVRASSGGASTGGWSSSSNPNLPSMGFYASADGGRTWTESIPNDAPQDATGGLQAQSLVMDPANSDVLYISFDFAGVYKSADGGRTWRHLTHGLPAGDFSYVRLAIAPGDPRVLYAAFNADAKGAGPETIYRSADGGARWTVLAGAPDSCAEQCAGNMHLAVDPTNPNVVYAGGTANYGYAFGTDRRCRTLYPLPSRCQTALMKTMDGGKTWADVAENGKNGPIHPDNHAILIDPANHNVIYEGGDGGVFYSADGGRTWSDLNAGLATFQVQGLSVGPTGLIYAGTQDNGTFMYAGRTTWKHVDDGDGGMTAADPTRPNVSYHTMSGATLYRNDHKGAPGENVFIAPFWGDYDDEERGQFYEPFALAPSRPRDVFYGTYRVWRSMIGGGVNGPRRDPNGPDATDDRGDTIDWMPISFDLSCPARPANPATTCDSAENDGQGISAVAVSPVNPSVVAAATANGHVWLTTNALAPVRTDQTCDPRANAEDVARCTFVGGVSWTRIDRGLPRRFPTSLQFAPGSSTTLYLTLSGFDENTPKAGGHVFVSADAGRSWTSLDGQDAGASLPDLPFNDIVINPANRHLYAAADFGIYLSTDGGKSWSLMNGGLPGATTYQMQLDARTQTLLVGTYGRGVWQGPAP